MRLAAILLAFAASTYAASPTVTYTRSFPGSTPDYICISIDRAGALTYSETLHDTQPLRTQLPAPDTASLFDLAAKLDYFHTPLESGLKVANMGKKTFRYDDGSGAPASEASFNYSIHESAQTLQARFEQIAATEHAYFDLDRTAHFDKLGVNDALAEIEALWLHKQLVAPLQFIPLLTRISTHETYMHLVRDRAARLKDEFTAPAPPPAGPTGSSQP